MAELLAKGVTSQLTDIPLNNTLEFIVMTSARVPVRVATCMVHIRAWGQVTPGASTTALTGRIYRGASATGGVVGEANTIPLATAPGSTEQVMLEAVELRSNAESVQYTFVVQQAGATAAGAFLQGVMEVEVLSG